MPAPPRPASSQPALNAGGIPGALWAAAGAHAALHAWYILTWHSSPHTARVIRLSSDDAKRRFQKGKYSGAELA